MSQVLKGSARTGKGKTKCNGTQPPSPLVQPCSTQELLVPQQASASEMPIPSKTQKPSASASKLKAVSKRPIEKPILPNAAPPKKPRTRALVPPKEMDVSVTISVGSDDVPIGLLEKVDEFLQKECISGLCSIERGSGLLKRHLQMVCRLLTSSAAMVSKTLKLYLGWDDPKNVPAGHHILTKVLRNTGLHTYIAMLGYCSKDKGQDHFQCIQKNVSEAELKEGEEEYIKYGTPFAKNRIVLTHKNLIERAATYCRFKLRKQLGSTLPGTLLPMLQSGQYIPSASWVLPVRQGGMEFNRATALWKCMMNPQSVDMQDVTQIFFEHTNPGSQLADLGRQRLAAELNEAREGAVHEYDISGDVPILPVHKPVIVLDASQDDLLPHEDIVETESHHTLTTSCPSMFIPVVFGDRDVANDLTV